MPSLEETLQDFIESSKNNNITLTQNSNEISRNTDEIKKATKTFLTEMNKYIDVESRVIENELNESITTKLNMFTK